MHGLLALEAVARPVPPPTNSGATKGVTLATAGVRCVRPEDHRLVFGVNSRDLPARSIDLHQRPGGVDTKNYVRWPPVSPGLRRIRNGLGLGLALTRRASTRQGRAQW